MSRTYRRPFTFSKDFNCLNMYSNTRTIKPFLKRLRKRLSRRSFKWWYDYNSEMYDYQHLDKPFKRCDTWKWT